MAITSRECVVAHLAFLGTNDLAFANASNIDHFRLLLMLWKDVLCLILRPMNARGLHRVIVGTGEVAISDY